MTTLNHSFIHTSFKIRSMLAGIRHADMHPQHDFVQLQAFVLPSVNFPDVISIDRVQKSCKRYVSGIPGLPSCRVVGMEARESWTAASQFDSSLL